MHPTGVQLLWFLGGIVLGVLAAVVVRPRRERKSAGAGQQAPAGTPASPIPPIAAPEPAIDAAPPHDPPSALLIDVTAARAAGFNMKHADDLGVIQGIGPRTAELLRSNGIDTLLRIAQLAPADLLAVLERGGPSYAFADPSTWPEQAALASANRWSELRQRQQAWLRQHPLEQGTHAPPPTAARDG